MESVTDGNEDAGPVTYARGYRRLPQEDMDLAPPSEWESTPPEQVPPEERQPYPAFQPSYTQDPQFPAASYSPASQFGAGYAPAPQSFQAQQQNSSNVVVVNQQPGPTSSMTVMEDVGEPPDDHLIFTICSIVVCLLLCNWLSLFCLVPALFLSITANNANGNRNYTGARRLANFSLGFSITAYVLWLVQFLLLAAVVAVFFTVDLAFLGLETPDL